MDTVGEGMREWKEGRNSTDIRTIPSVNELAGEKLLYSTGHPACCCVMTQRGEMGRREGGSRGRK